MARVRPFRFGVQAAAPPPGTSWPELARTVEGLGYSTLTVSDHLDDQYAITPALMAAADATTVLRVGSLTYCNDYRHPVVLAKEAATLDLLSGGRLELGLGAGWMTTDYAQSGIGLDPPGARIERLAEALDIVTGLWSDSPCTVEGRHYAVRGLVGHPKPVQQPGPPILVGGGGRRLLTLAARRADIIGLNIALGAGRIDESAGPSATDQATRDKIGWIRDAAGDRFDQIELHVPGAPGHGQRRPRRGGRRRRPDLRADPGRVARLAPRPGRHGGRDRRPVPRPPRAVRPLLHRARARRHGGDGPGGGRAGGPLSLENRAIRSGPPGTVRRWTRPRRPPPARRRRR